MSRQITRLVLDSWDLPFRSQKHAQEELEQRIQVMHKRRRLQQAAAAVAYQQQQQQQQQQQHQQQQKRSPTADSSSASPPLWRPGLTLPSQHRLTPSPSLLSDMLPPVLAADLSTASLLSVGGLPQVTVSDDTVWRTSRDPAARSVQTKLAEQRDPQRQSLLGDLLSSGLSGTALTPRSVPPALRGKSPASPQPVGKAVGSKMLRHAATIHVRAYAEEQAQQAQQAQRDGSRGLSCRDRASMSVADVGRLVAEDSLSKFGFGRHPPQGSGDERETILAVRPHTQGSECVRSQQVPLPRSIGCALSCQQQGGASPAAKIPTMQRPQAHNSSGRMSRLLPEPSHSPHGISHLSPAARQQQQQQPETRSPPWRQQRVPPVNPNTTPPTGSGRRHAQQPTHTGSRNIKLTGGSVVAHPSIRAPQQQTMQRHAEAHAGYSSAASPRLSKETPPSSLEEAGNRFIASLPLPRWLPSIGGAKQASLSRPEVQ